MLPANFPSDSTQARILKAFSKVGFNILPCKYGNGSHRVVECPKTKIKITVQHKIYKEVIKSYLKVVDQLGYDAQDFIRYL